LFNDGPSDTHVINLFYNTESCIVEGETFEGRIELETRGGERLQVVHLEAWTEDQMRSKEVQQIREAQDEIAYYGDFYPAR
jgi:hypothetical protein